VPSSSSSRPSALGSTAARGEPRGRPGPATLAIANCYNPSNHWQTQPSLLPSPLPPPHQVLPTHHQTQGSPALLQPPYQAVTGSGLQWGGAPRPWHPFLPTCAPRPTRMPIQHKADPQEATPFQTSPSLQRVACQDAAPQVAMSHPPPPMPSPVLRPLSGDIWSSRISEINETPHRRQRVPRPRPRFIDTEDEVELVERPRVHSTPRQQAPQARARRATTVEVGDQESPL
jgi:hypothetical protein